MRGGMGGMAQGLGSFGVKGRESLGVFGPHSTYVGTTWDYFKAKVYILWVRGPLGLLTDWFCRASFAPYHGVVEGFFLRISIGFRQAVSDLGLHGAWAWVYKYVLGLPLALGLLRVVGVGHSCCPTPLFKDPANNDPQQRKKPSTRTGMGKTLRASWGKA